MNLDYALEQDYISEGLKNRIRKLISEWSEKKRPLTDPFIQEWIQECIKHFGANNAKQHIQKFYPEFSNVIV